MNDINFIQTTIKEIKTDDTGITALIDSDGKVGKLYGAKTTPHFFIINPKGTLAYQGAIDSISSFQASDVPEAENYVAKALEELLQNRAVSTSSTKPYGCSVKY